MKRDSFILNLRWKKGCVNVDDTLRSVVIADVEQVRDRFGRHPVQARALGPSPGLDRGPASFPSRYFRNDSYDDNREVVARVPIIATR